MYTKEIDGHIKIISEDRRGLTSEDTVGYTLIDTSGVDPNFAGVPSNYEVIDGVVTLMSVEDVDARNAEAAIVSLSKEELLNAEASTTVTYLDKQWTFSEKRLAQFGLEIALGDPVDWTHDGGIEIQLTPLQAKNIGRKVRDALKPLYRVYRDAKLSAATR